MRSIRVQRVLAVDPQRAFELLSDHAGLDRFPGIRAARLLSPGEAEPNGVGAVRRVEPGGGAWFEEEITQFERPRTYGYRIVRSVPPVRHEGGWLELVPVAQGVSVTWTSSLEVAVPVVGPLLTAVLARLMSRSFGAALDALPRLA